MAERNAAPSTPIAAPLFPEGGADAGTQGLASGAPDWPALIERLSAPFPAAAVHWRAGAVSRDRKRAQALPYVEPRLYEDRLNAVCPGDWQVTFKPWGEKRLVCELTIFGLTRASTGEFDDGDTIAQGTAAEAQAFKRACSKFGLGRYLYDIPIVWVDYDNDRRRLSDTPELSGRFVPSAAPPPAPRAAGGAASDGSGSAGAGPETPGFAAVDASGSAAALADTLSQERAAAMQRELEKLGLPRSEQRTFAAAALGRRIGAFTDLTDSEALEVWNAAKRTHSDVAV